MPPSSSPNCKNTHPALAFPDSASGTPLPPCAVPKTTQLCSYLPGTLCTRRLSGLGAHIPHGAAQSTVGESAFPLRDALNSSAPPLPPPQPLPLPGPPPAPSATPDPSETFPTLLQDSRNPPGRILPPPGSPLPLQHPLIPLGPPLPPLSPQLTLRVLTFPLWDLLAPLGPPFPPPGPPRPPPGPQDPSGNPRDSSGTTLTPPGSP